MSVSSDSAEQLVKLCIDQSEFALKIAGRATEDIIKALYAMSKDTSKTKGKVRLKKMLNSDRELNIFTINKDDMKIFAKEAKSYGVLYCALINKHNKNIDGVVDVLVRAEDAPKINRIVDRFNLNTLDKAKIITEQLTKEFEQNKQDNKDISENAPDKGYETKNVDDNMIDDIFSKPIQKEENSLPLESKTEINHQLENFSQEKNLQEEGTVKHIKGKSVKEELKEIKEEMKVEEQAKTIEDVMKMDITQQEPLIMSKKNKNKKERGN